MKDDKEIFVSDTTIKLSVLKKNLSDNYDLHLITPSQKYLYIALISALSLMVIYKYSKQ